MGNENGMKADLPLFQRNDIMDKENRFARGNAMKMCICRSDGQ